MTPDDLMRIAENQKKIAANINQKLDTIQEIIKRLTILEKWEGYSASGGPFDFFHNLDIFDIPQNTNRSTPFCYNLNHRRIAPKIIPILKEELLHNLQFHNKELDKLKEQLTGVKEESK